MSGLQNVRSSKCPVAKKNIHIYSVLVVGGNPKGSVAAMFAGCVLFSVLEIYCHISPKSLLISKNYTLFTVNMNENLAIPILFI
jgi:hypothetical protein